MKDWKDCRDADLHFLDPHGDVDPSVYDDDALCKEFEAFVDEQSYNFVPGDRVKTVFGDGVVMRLGEDPLHKYLDVKLDGSDKTIRTCFLDEIIVIDEEVKDV